MADFATVFGADQPHLNGVNPRHYFQVKNGHDHSLDSAELPLK